MNKRERAAAEKAHKAWTERVLKEHADLRAQILALRPSWDPAKLEAVRQSYGTTDAGLPGLFDILKSIKAMDALDAAFR